MLSNLLFLQFQHRDTTNHADFNPVAFHEYFLTEFYNSDFAFNKDDGRQDCDYEWQVHVDKQLKEQEKIPVQ